MEQVDEQVVTLAEYRERGLYAAKAFRVPTIYGEFHISGTLCGHVDVAVPQGGTLTLSPDEVAALVTALTSSRADVLAHAQPFDDPRLVERPV